MVNDDMKEIGVMELANLLGVSRKTIWELEQKGIIKKKKNGKFDLKEAVQAFLQYKQSQIERKLENIEIEEAERRKKIAEARLKELELAEKEGKLLLADKVKEVWIKHISNARAKLLAIPAKYAPLVLASSDVNEAKKILEDAIYEALEELSKDG